MSYGTFPPYLAKEAEQERRKRRGLDVKGAEFLAVYMLLRCFARGQ